MFLISYYVGSLYTLQEQYTSADPGSRHVMLVSSQRHVAELVCTVVALEVRFIPFNHLVTKELK